MNNSRKSAPCLAKLLQVPADCPCIFNRQPNPTRAAMQGDQCAVTITQRVKHHPYPAVIHCMIALINGNPFVWTLNLPPALFCYHFYRQGTEVDSLKITTAFNSAGRYDNSPTEDNLAVTCLYLRQHYTITHVLHSSIRANLSITDLMCSPSFPSLANRYAECELRRSHIPLPIIDNRSQNRQYWRTRPALRLRKPALVSKQRSRACYRLEPI